MDKVVASLGAYLVGKEIGDRNNTKLKTAVLADDIKTYEALIQKGYNPFRVDADGNRAYEYSNDAKYLEAASEWVGQLAMCMNPDLADESDDSDE
jgi:hypothetical protein